MNRSMKSLAVLAAAAILLLAGATAQATDYTLADGNSSVIFSPSASTGMRSWTVDSQQLLNTQWFWYRVGTAAEQPLNALSLGTVTPSGTGSTGGFTNLHIPYSNVGYTVDLTYILFGGQAGSLTSNMSAVVKVTNTGTSALDFHIFQYADFNLSAGADTVQISGSGTNINNAIQTADANHLSEVITTPPPSHYEAGLVTASNSILARLTGGSATTLGDVAGPTAAGDAAWAFEWDQSIAPGQVLQISKEMSVMPEPATLTLLGLGLAVGLWTKRKG